MSKNAVATTSQRTEISPAAESPVKGKVSLIARIAARYEIDADKANDTLKATAFRQRGKEGKPAVEVSNEQMMMLLIVADQYHLNPFTREIYAFPSDNGIVPIISVDGWIRIINERPELQAIEFEYAPAGTDDPWIACTITRRDRSAPIVIREYMSECYRDTLPWKSHSKRMLRHKALIQAARVAFGFAGAYDPDEAERIMEATVVSQQTPAISGKPKTQAPRELKQDIERISMDQSTVLADMIKEEGIDVSAVLSRFEVGSLDEIPASGYESAKAIIGSLSGA